jgi:hypothetical protein
MRRGVPQHASQRPYVLRPRGQNATPAQQETQRVECVAARPLDQQQRAPNHGWRVAPLCPAQNTDFRCFLVDWTDGRTLLRGRGVLLCKRRERGCAALLLSPYSSLLLSDSKGLAGRYRAVTRATKQAVVSASEVFHVNHGSARHRHDGSTNSVRGCTGLRLRECPLRPDAWRGDQRRRRTRNSWTRASHQLGITDAP